MKLQTIQYYREKLIEKLKKLRDYYLSYNEFRLIIGFLSSAEISNGSFIQKVNQARGRYGNELSDLIINLRCLIHGASKYVRHLKETFPNDLEIDSLSLRHTATFVLMEELGTYSYKKAFSILKRNQILGLFRSIFMLNFHGKLANLKAMVIKYQKAIDKAQKQQLNNDIKGLILMKKEKEVLDFSDLEISGLDLSDLNLAGADFSGCKLKNADFSRSNLHGAGFSSTSRDKRSELLKIKFDHADCTAAIFDYSEIKESSFNNTVLNDISLYEAKLDRDAIETFVKYIKKDPNNPRFKLDHISLEGENLRRMNLSYLYLKGVYFRGCDLRGANFEKTDVHGSDFKKAKFSGGELSETLKLTLNSAIFENEKKRKFASLGQGYNKITDFFKTSTSLTKKRQMKERIAAPLSKRQKVSDRNRK